MGNVKEEMGNPANKRADEPGAVERETTVKNNKEEKNCLIVLIASPNSGTSRQRSLKATT